MKKSLVIAISGTSTDKIKQLLNLLSRRLENSHAIDPAQQETLADLATEDYAYIFLQPLLPGQLASLDIDLAVFLDTAQEARTRALEQTSLTLDGNLDNAELADRIIDFLEKTTKPGLNQSSPYMLRLATSADLAAVTELLFELYGRHSYEDLLAENRSLLASRRQFFYLAFSGELPLAVCQASLRDEYVNGKRSSGTVGYLEAIYVRPSYRYQGLAKALVAQCEAWASENGCCEFLSDCALENLASYKFHLKIGFFETERIIFFRKDLS